jgi:nitrite reductase/ring-hydroxylating ferredoxin subunit
MGDCTRREFHLLLAAAGLAACGSSTAATLTPANDLVTLSFAQFPALANGGGSVVVDVQDRFPIVVVRTGDASALALSATCTHAGCIMSWNGMAVHCPCHNASFSSTGAVLGGPTTIPVPVYAASVQSDAIVVNLA